MISNQECVNLRGYLSKVQFLRLVLNLILHIYILEFHLKVSLVLPSLSTVNTSGFFKLKDDTYNVFRPLKPLNIRPLTDCSLFPVNSSSKTPAAPSNAPSRMSLSLLLLRFLQRWSRRRQLLLRSNTQHTFQVSNTSFITLTNDRNHRQCRLRFIIKQTMLWLHPKQALWWFTG